MLETNPLLLYLSPQLLYFHHLVTSAGLGFWLMNITVETNIGHVLTLFGRQFYPNSIAQHNMSFTSKIANMTIPD